MGSGVPFPGSSVLVSHSLGSLCLWAARLVQFSRMAESPVTLVTLNRCVLCSRH